MNFVLVALRLFQLKLHKVCKKIQNLLKTLPLFYTEMIVNAWPDFFLPEVYLITNYIFDQSLIETSLRCEQSSLLSHTA